MQTGKQQHESSRLLYTNFRMKGREGVLVCLHAISDIA